jgi:hypothetical protein
MKQTLEQRGKKLGAEVNRFLNTFDAEQLEWMYHNALKDLKPLSQRACTEAYMTRVASRGLKPETRFQQ